MHRATASLLLLLTTALLVACSSDDSAASATNGVPSPEAGATLPDGSTPPSLVAEGGTADAATSDGATPEAGDAAAETGTPAGVVAPCSSLPGTLVYVESGDTQENLLKNLGRSLRDTANITLVFNLTGSCTLTNDMYTGARMVPNGTLKYIPSTAENGAWTTAQPESTCTTDATGAPIDVAISALFVESCGLGGPPAGSSLALVQGPVQAYTFVAPTASDQTAIWAEEAYYAFGFGNANPLAPTYNPWNDERFLFTRPPTKSTLVATAKNIALPPNKWKGVPQAASSDVVNAVSTSTSPEATLGILGAEVYDGARSKGIKTLAFQAFGQHGAYYPDSTSTAFDKQNLRDGHYTLWSPTVYLTKVDSTNVPLNPAVRYLTDLVLGKPGATAPLTSPGATPFDGLAAVVKVGLIPQCAMKVTRASDGGDLAPFTPQAPCDCYYASKIPGVTGAPAGCVACTTAASCGGGSAACNHGFCEPSARVVPPTPDAGASCFAGTPATHAQILDACTSATSIAKNVVLPSAPLPPLP